MLKLNIDLFLLFSFIENVIVHKHFETSVLTTLDISHSKNVCTWVLPTFTCPTTPASLHLPHYTCPITPAPLHLPHYTCHAALSPLHLPTTPAPLHISHYTYSTTPSPLHLPYYTVNCHFVQTIAFFIVQFRFICKLRDFQLSESKQSNALLE